MTRELNIHILRVYERTKRTTGMCYLVDRLWPRGTKKSDLNLDGWPKGVAPSDALRQWFRHDPTHWNQFVDRYFAQLDEKPDIWRPLLDAARTTEGVTLLFAARDAEHSNAAALRRYLEVQHRKMNEEYHEPRD